MRKLTLIHRSLALLTVIFVVALGLFVITPKEVSAFPDLGENCLKCHPEGEYGTGTGEPAEPADPNDPSEPVEPAKPLIPLPPYEPLPVELVDREVNNALLGGGLGLAALIIGGAIVMDRRRK